MSIVRKVKVPAVPAVIEYTASCDRCGRTLDNEHLYGTNFQEALDVRLNGGYGQFIDFCDGPAALILCETCANLLVEFLGYTKHEIVKNFT